MILPKLEQFESSSYPYSVTARADSIKQNKQALQEIRNNAYGTTLKEALTSDALSGFIPDLFLDEVILLGQRTAIARNNFPVVGQSTQSSFKQRYRYKDEGPFVTGKELQEVRHTQSERETAEFSFLKIMDSNVISAEMASDSTLDEAMAEMTLSANKIYRRENQLMAHRLAEYSEGTIADKWGNYVSGIAAGGTDDALITSLETAFLDITSRLTDRFPKETLTWFVSTEVYSRLFKLDEFRRYDILGAQPNLVTGTTPNIFGIPTQIWEPGYFDKDSVWTPEPYDIFLVATQFAAGIRERWSLRTTPLSGLEKILGQGVMLFERLIPWVRNPFAYVRISPNENYEDMIGSMNNIHIMNPVESPKVFNN